MKRYQMKIKLLSDLCVSDGGVYNSYLDTDICHDSYGFPYIPARRIKGCLRECGLELADWGENISKNDVDKLFGAEGSDVNRAKVRIGDALLKNYQELLEQAKTYEDNLIFHPQNILNHYSYIRTQTSINYETGVADPTTLRTIRVANKGLKFISEVELEEEYQDLFKKCCDTFTNIGIGRTRGLGEIRVKLKGVKETEPTGMDKGLECIDPKSEYVTFSYEITLKEPMICKSIDGGETKSLDYIEGAKILGLIANEVKNKGMDFIEFMNRGELFCSNAYLAINHERCMEVPASYYSIKNNDNIYQEKRKTPKIDEKDEEPNIQLNQMKHCYIHKDSYENLIRENVKLEERYHHRRPEDKSIGRAREESSEDSNFYQISSIVEGQTFRGYVYGKSTQIKTAYECLKPLQTVYLGYSHSAEYGKANLEVFELKTETEIQAREIEVADFCVKLESPTLIYNNQAFYSTNMDDLDAEIRSALDIGDLTDKDEVYRYVNYTTLGGYNVTWNAPKPMVEAFDKGTIFYYHLNQPTKLTVPISAPDRLLIGERISEGLGEASFHILDSSAKDVMEKKEGQFAEKNGENKTTIAFGSLANKLCKELFSDFVRACAVEEASIIASEDTKESNETKIRSAINNKMNKIKPTISIMLLICQDKDSLEDVNEATIKRFAKSGDKQEKMDFAHAILDLTESRCSMLPDEFNKVYNIRNFKTDCESLRYDFKYVYLKEFLQQLKYVIRYKEEKKKSEGKNHG